MKKIWIISMMTIISIAMLSCSKDIQVNDDYKDITIIYGLLDSKDSLSYIRIEKAFLSEGNIYQDAQIADSNQYPYKLDVSISDGNGMNIVFDTTTVYNKQEGIFYKDKMKVYVAETQGKLQPNTEYTLKVHNPKTGQEQTGKCKLLDASAFLYESYYPGPRVSFIKTHEVKFKTIPNVSAYQLMIRFHYIDSLTTDHSLSYHYVDMSTPILFSNSNTPGIPLNIGINGSVWFNNIKAKIPVKEDVLRFEGKVEFFMYMADPDYKTYIEIHQPSNSLVIDRPEFTNITNGYGLFAARTRYVTEHKLNNKTVVKLQEIKELNFVRRN